MYYMYNSWNVLAIENTIHPDSCCITDWVVNIRVDCLNCHVHIVVRIGVSKMYLCYVNRGEIEHRLLLPSGGMFGCCVIGAHLLR